MHRHLETNQARVCFRSQAKACMQACDMQAPGVHGGHALGPGAYAALWHTRVLFEVSTAGLLVLGFLTLMHAII